MHQHPNIPVGTYVVIDPTGRGLADCLEVGRVTAFDAEDGYTVALNSGDTVGAVTSIQSRIDRSIPEEAQA